MNLPQEIEKPKSRKAKKSFLTRRRRLGRLSRPQHAGKPPGTIASVKGALPSTINLMLYDTANVSERTLSDTKELASVKEAATARVAWIDVIGLGDTATFDELRDAFGLHALALEDVLNLRQRPKLETYGETSFIVLGMPTTTKSGLELEIEQLSVFVAGGVVITIQEHPGDCLGQVRDRIRRNKGRIRRSDYDYLAYAVLDAVVDSYFPVVEGYADRLEDLESEIILGRTDGVVATIHAVRHDLRRLRRAIWPMREVVTTMMRVADDSDSDTHLFLRDCYDHTIRLIEGVDTYRELATSLMDLHLSNVSMRMNETMKVLTIIATIFMPLGFIAGLYGMNFDGDRSSWNMPELRWQYGYPFALGLMGATVLGLLVFFRWKGWLGERSKPADEHGEVT